MITIKRAVLRRLRLPIIKPYRLSYRTFDDFEPFVVEVEAADGRLAFGDGHISPGSSSETRAGGWDFLVRHLADLPGADTRTAKKRVLGEFEHCKVAATACATVIEVLEDNPILHTKHTTRLPILTPIGSPDRKSIAAEVEEALGAGFGTFKIKVEKELAADIEPLGWIQDATQRRATLRVDANRERFFTNPLPFSDGVVTLTEDYWPELDPSKLERLTVEVREFG